MTHLRPFLVILSSCICIHTNVYAGIKIGNGDGGDAVICKADTSPGSNTPTDGFYALDYLGTLGLQFGANVEPATWQESAARIQSILDRVSPTLSSSFRAYVEDIKNATDYTRRFVWEEAPYGLIKIDDQNIVALVPDNCQVHSTVELIPAVVHQNDQISGRPPGMQLYAYVPSVLKELERTSALQLSYLYVHEWLWNHSSNVGRNRRINRFLHSVAPSALSDAAIREQLTGMGLNLEPSAPVDTPLPPPQSKPQPKAPAFRAPEPTEFQEVLFAMQTYCGPLQNHDPQRIDAKSDFRLYSQFMHVSNDLSTHHTKYEPFGFPAGDGKTHMLTYKLSASLANDGDESTLVLDGGEAVFECTGFKSDAQAGEPIKMDCRLRRNEETLYWPQSSVQVRFIGYLFQGCFIAKADTNPQYHDWHAIVITGKF